MYKYLFVVLVAIFLFGCGGEEETVIPTVLTLDNIGNKSITIGDPALNFSVTAFDPDDLNYSFESTGQLGADPYVAGASFNAGTGTFNWDVTSVAAGDYFVTFKVTNSNSDTDSEEIQITVLVKPGEFVTGQNLYNADCQSCHGTGGTGGGTPIVCIDKDTFDATINNGTMATYANGWSTADKDAVHYYLNNVNPTACEINPI